MDLKERLKDKINSYGLPVNCLPGYLDGRHDPELRLQMLPGSTVVDMDYAGNKTEQYLMECMMRGNDESAINTVLWTIANKLGDSSFIVDSADDSFVYNGLTIASMPHPIMADTTGAVTYAMDFKITVDTFSK